MNRTRAEDRRIARCKLKLFQALSACEDSELSPLEKNFRDVLRFDNDVLTEIEKLEGDRSD